MNKGEYIKKLEDLYKRAEAVFMRDILLVDNRQKDIIDIREDFDSVLVDFSAEFDCKEIDEFQEKYEEIESWESEIRRELEPRNIGDSWDDAYDDYRERRCL